MSVPISSENKNLQESNKLKNKVQWAFAGIILLAYFGIVIFLASKSTSEGPEWQKLTYIFSSIEAIVFTAVGFIFGREVNLSRAVKAENNEEKTKKESKKLAKKVMDKFPKSTLLKSKSLEADSDTRDVDDLMNLAESILLN